MSAIPAGYKQTEVEETPRVESAEWRVESGERKVTDNFQLSTLHSQLPKGYKQTEVGVIPEDWDVSTVGSEFSVQLGKMLDAEKNFGTPKPYLGNKSVQWGLIDFRGLPTVPMSRDDLTKFRLEKGDLLVCEGGEVGRAAIWEAPIDECYYQKALHRLRPLRGLDTRLMAALLRFRSDSGGLADYVTQTSIAHLPREKFIEVPIPRPPRDEQRAIAAALSDVDALLAKLDQFIAKKRDLKQAAMQQLLTGQTRLPGFSGAWEVQAIKSIVETPVTDGPHLTPRFLEDGVPFLSVNNLVNNKIDFSDLRFISKEDDIEFSKKCKPRKGDLLLGKAASVGKVAFIEVDMDLNIWSPIAMIRIDKKSDPRFVYYQLQSADLTKQITLLTNSSSQGNIGMGDIEKLLLQLPAYAEQTAIATVLSDMDAELAALEARRDKTRALKQGMMQELLTGRIRLVESGELKVESSISGKLRGES